MTWLLPVLALALALVVFGGAFFVLRPSRGESAGRIARPVQARMEAHPVRSYYLPMAVFVVASVAAVPGVVAAGPIEARVTGAVLAAIPLLGVALLVRFRRWPTMMPKT